MEPSSQIQKETNEHNNKIYDKIILDKKKKINIKSNVVGA